MKIESFHLMSNFNVYKYNHINYLDSFNLYIFQDVIIFPILFIVVSPAPKRVPETKKAIFFLGNG